jgi:hypothetical protein
VRLGACALVIGVSSLGLLGVVHPADSTVDDGLLEFLGSVDSDDKNWHHYLADTDIDQVARRARNPAPSRPAAPPVNGGAVPPADPPADPPAASTAPPVGHP